MFDRESGRYLPPDGAQTRPQHNKRKFGAKYGELFGPEGERRGGGDGRSMRSGRRTGNERDVGINTGRKEDSIRGTNDVDETRNTAETSARGRSHADAREADRTTDTEGATNAQPGKDARSGDDHAGPTLLRREEEDAD